MIDWSREVEAYHEDGRVVPLGCAHKVTSTIMGTNQAPVGVHPFWNLDGTERASVLSSGWRVRNVARASIFVRNPDEARQADDIRRLQATSEHPTPTQYAPELVERMVALCRRAADTSASEDLHGSAWCWVAREADQIVADLPPKVDPDEAYADQLIRAMGWAGQAEIGEVAVRRLVAQAYAAGRQLQRGEAA